MTELLSFSQEDIVHALKEHVRRNRRWTESKVSLKFFKGEAEVAGLRVSAVVERTPVQGEDPY